MKRTRQEGPKRFATEEREQNPGMPVEQVAELLYRSGEMTGKAAGIRHFEAAMRAHGCTESRDRIRAYRERCPYLRPTTYNGKPSKAWL